MKIKLDLSGFELFWNIVEKIETSTEPSEEEWISLFNTPGYQALTTTEFNEDFFKQSFLAVFDPERKEKLDRLLEGKTKRYLRYYIQVKKNKQIYEKNVKMIKDRWESLNETIYARAVAFLPYKEPEKDPTVSIVIFDVDARGYSTIAVDAIFTSRIEDFVSITAHEVHHFYRNQLLEYEKENVEEEDKELIWILNQIQSEGIADHIDKDYFIYGRIETSFPKAYVKHFTESVDQAPEIINEINTLFQKYKQSELSTNELGSEVKKIVPLAGHPLGYYMTKIIIKNAHFDDLIRIVGNPFKFFKLYNKSVVSERENIPLYSETTIEIIEDFEKKYVK